MKLKLHLLVDTCVWLNLAKHQHLPLLEAMFAMTEVGELTLIVPQVVLDEFARNREKVVAGGKVSLASQFKRVRDAVQRYAPEAERDASLRILSEVDHRIATGPDAGNEAIQLIEKLLTTSVPVAASNGIKARAAERGLAKLAPFHRHTNSMGDAVIFETYAEALVDRQDDELFAFVTENTQDFSISRGDTRLPHPDLAPFFDGDHSRYSTNIAALLNDFAGELVEEIRFDRDFNQDSRSLGELVEAENTLFKQVWFNRHWNLRSDIESGRHKLVTREEWDKAGPGNYQGITIDTVWAGALAAAKRTEEELGPDNIGPWTDFEWGMLNGKLSAIRWMLGDDWDMLDT